jgi:hypothetical protein
VPALLFVVSLPANGSAPAVPLAALRSPELGRGHICARWRADRGCHACDPAGRERLASDFLGKVVWGCGALAGVQGTAAVIARIGGGEGEVELEGLPFKGEVRIGGRK